MSKLIQFLLVLLVTCLGAACGKASFKGVIELDGVTVTRNAAYTGPVSTLDTQGLGSCAQSNIGQVAFEGTHTVTTGCCGAGEDATRQLAIFAEAAVLEIRQRFEADGVVWPTVVGFHENGSRILVCSNGNANQGGAANGVGVWVVSADSKAIDKDRTSEYWKDKYRIYRQLVKHEMVHAMHQNVYQSTDSMVFDPCIANSSDLKPNRTIAWMSEGLATWISGQTISSVSSFIASNRVPSILQLDGVQSFSDYPLAATATRYLLSPVSVGGAGNDLLTFINFIKACRLDSDPSDGPFYDTSFAAHFTISGAATSYESFIANLKSWIANLQ